MPALYRAPALYMAPALLGIGLLQGGPVVPSDDTGTIESSGTIPTNFLRVDLALLTAAAVPAAHDGLHYHQGERVLVCPGGALESQSEVGV